MKNNRLLLHDLFYNTCKMAENLQFSEVENYENHKFEN